MNTMTTLSTPVAPDLGELAAASRELEHAPASRVLDWAWDRFGEELVLAASFQDCVLIDVATKVAPDVEVVFLDTGFHFSETLVTLRRAQSRYRLNLRVERAAPDAPDLFEVGTEGCCAARKVALLDRALLDKDAWLTGLRRSEAETRTAAPIVSRDKRGLVKVCPLANWSDDDVARYIADNDIIVNPLQYEGYPSIGCWPCTEPVLEGEDPRAGRWRGSGKTECGLHFS